MVQGHFEIVSRFLDDNTGTQLRGLFLNVVQSYNLSWGYGEQTDATLFPRPSRTTVLHLAACERFPEIVELLLEEGACR
jgi:hypothetical protein